MDFEKFYEVLIGQANSEEGYPVENCFAGECEKLYDDIARSRRHINARLSRNLYQEPAQVLAIMNAYEGIQRILCKRAFEYGVRYGRGEIEL